VLLQDVCKREGRRRASDDRRPSCVFLADRSRGRFRGDCSLPVLISHHANPGASSCRPSSSRSAAPHARRLPLSSGGRLGALLRMNRGSRRDHRRGLEGGRAGPEGRRTLDSKLRCPRGPRGTSSSAYEHGPWMERCTRPESRGALAICSCGGGLTAARARHGTRHGPDRRSRLPRPNPQTGEDGPKPTTRGDATQPHGGPRRVRRDRDGIAAWRVPAPSSSKVSRLSNGRS